MLTEIQSQYEAKEIERTQGIDWAATLGPNPYPFKGDPEENDEEPKKDQEELHMDVGPPSPTTGVKRGPTLQEESESESSGDDDSDEPGYTTPPPMKRRQIPPPLHMHFE